MNPRVGWVGLPLVHFNHRRCGKVAESRRAIRYLRSIEAGKTFPDPQSVVVYLHWLNSDYFGVARTQASQFVAYRFRLVLVVKAPPPRVIGRPSAAAAVVLSCDRCIYSGSKRDGVRHCALLTQKDGVALAHC